MKRFIKASLAASLCLAVTAMFAPVDRAAAQFRVYAGPGGVGIGLGNSGYGGYGNYGYGYGTRGYRGNSYGFYPSYGNYNQGYRSYYRGNRGLGSYPSYGYRSYGTPYYSNRGYRGYSNRGYSNSYTPRSYYSYQQSTPSYAVQPAMQEDTRPDRPVMGIRIRSAREGVRVVVVQPDSPAAEAGLQEGDLITSFNGKRVTTEQALLSELDQLEPNAETQLSIRSGDRTWDTSMQLTTYQQAFMGNVAEREDDARRTVGRPMLDDQRTPDALQRENEQLRREVDRLRGTDPNNVDPSELEIGEPPVEPGATTGEAINPDGNAVPNPPAGEAELEEAINPSGNVAPEGEVEAEADTI